MQAEIVERTAVQATVKVTVPAAAVDGAFEAVLTTLAKRVRVPGFRPGKAPRGVVERRVGEGALKDEVREKLVEDSYPGAVEQLALSPIHAHFHADTPERGSEFSFIVHAEFYPDIELPEITGIKLEEAPKAFDDEMLTDSVERLKREHATLVPVDRPAEAADWLLIETVPAPAEGGTPAADGQVDAADAANPNAFPIDLETAGGELASQLAGATIGSVVAVALSDENTPGEQGEPTKRTVHLRVHDIKAKEKPDPSAEFASQLGLATWPEVEAKIREGIEADLKRDGYERRRRELIDKLTAGATLELPPSLVRRRQQHLLRNLAEDLQGRGETLESYVKRLDARQKREEFEAELTEAAESGVRRDLVLERLVEQRGTSLSEDEFKEAIKLAARQRRQDVGTLLKEAGEEWLANYRFLLTRDKAVRELIEELTGEKLDDIAPRLAAAEAAQNAAAAESSSDDDEHDHDHAGHDHHHGHEHHGHDHHDHAHHDHAHHDQKAHEHKGHDQKGHGQRGRDQHGQDRGGGNRD